MNPNIQQHSDYLTMCVKPAPLDCRSAGFDGHIRLEAHQVKDEHEEEGGFINKLGLTGKGWDYDNPKDRYE